MKGSLTYSAYGRTRDEHGSAAGLGDDIRFESVPPAEAMLPLAAWDALNAIDTALQHAETRHYGGHRHR